MDSQPQSAREMPRYKCHKQVWALKIKAIVHEMACGSAEAGIVCGEAKRLHTPKAAKGDVGMDHDFLESTFDAPGAMIIPEEEGYGPFPVDEDYLRKHSPTVGGYFVQYADGYKSFSPAQAFEEGYTRV